MLRSLRHPAATRAVAVLAAATFAVLLVACGSEQPVAPEEEPVDMDGIAEAYVRLVLAVGPHDPNYVDAYYGPEDWRPSEDAEPRPLAELRSEAARLRVEVAATRSPDDELVALRRTYLGRQLEAVEAHLAMLAGERWSFDEESRALYDAVVPQREEAEFVVARDELAAALAEEGHASGELAADLAAFKEAFVIPPEKLATVFEAAIEACKERTAPWLELPEGESFTVEYVTDKPWSGYNWYQGEYRSLIQVNTDLPIFIDRAIDLACHEGYPGHHLYNSLLEQHLYRDRGWPELSVYPLFSPQSLIAEGTANFGIDMAFPGEERLAFEAGTLFPLAGLDPSRAEAYYRILELARALRYVDNEVARRYLDGELDAEAAQAFMVRFGSDPERAAQRLRFIETYRSYVINYTLGLDMVRAHVDARAGEDPAERWRVFGELLSTPRLPSGLGE